METRLIKDVQITASSEYSKNHAAVQARLNFKAGGGKNGGWSALSNDANQWIQVALGNFSDVTGIATQGRNGNNQWVTKYQLQYSDDGVNFDFYKASGQSSPKVKPYQSDRQFSIAFMAPFTANYLRIFYSFIGRFTGDIILQLMFRCSMEVRTARDNLQSTFVDINV